MATINKFLVAYKELETEIRSANPNDSVYDYENRLEDADKQEKLKLCRITRNYIQHHSDKFAEVSDTMVQFLEKETNLLHSKSDLVKKHIYRAEPITEKTTIKDAILLGATSKIDYIPIVNKGVFLGVVPLKAILVAYKKESTLSKKIICLISSTSIKKVMTDWEYAKPTDKYLDYVTKQKVIVTDDGTEHGLYVGVLKQC